jgi:hypothetical protein
MGEPNRRSPADLPRVDGRRRVMGRTRARSLVDSSNPAGAAGSVQLIPASQGTRMPTPNVTNGEKKLTRPQRWALILPTMRRPCPLQGLADLCGVSLRQFNRDIRELRELGHWIEIKNGRAFFAEGAAPADFMLAELFASELRYLVDFASAFGISQIADSIQALLRAAPEIEKARHCLWSPPTPRLRSITRAAVFSRRSNFATMQKERHSTLLEFLRAHEIFFHRTG